MKGVIAEGVAFDPVSRDFFVSSVRERKVWRVTPDGEFHDFGFGERGDGRPFGRTVDPERDCLWVALNWPGGTNPNGTTSQSMSGIRQFALGDDQGGMIGCFFSDEVEHVLGDLVVGPDRAIWATDSKTPALYRLDPDAEVKQRLQPVPIGDGWRNPQGLAFSERGELFVADYPRGIARVDPVAGSHAILKGSEERLRGVDGLYWHDGALYAIQNGTKTHRVLRVELDASRTAVERIDVLLEGPPLDDPTLGVFAEGAFFVNAASGWSDYTETGERADGAGRPLTEHRLVRIELDARR
ncbi:MAG: hypothetical protein IT453_16345 [Planctomycetes bacterium]|nr:hypothetical protein [Planctomycetota bacterium]